MLVSVAELATYMDIRFSARQNDAAVMVLAGLQGEMEEILRRPVEVGEFVETHILEAVNTQASSESIFYNPYLNTSGVSSPTTYVDQPITVYLRNSPVVSVSSVTIYHPYAGAASVCVAEHSGYTVRRFGIDLYSASPNDRVVVAYRGGLDGPLLPVFRGMILRAASREMQNMHDDVVGVKDLSARDVALAVTGFTAEERSAIRSKKRTRIN